MAGTRDRPRLTPREAFAAFREGRIRLIDIRRADEWLLASPCGAERRSIESLLDSPPDERTPLVLICGAGRRSAQAVKRLTEAGIEARDVEGGLEAWQAGGFPIETPDSPLSMRERERYQRHLALPGFGQAGQLALRRARVLLVGCGGLGSSAALYLAAAGVGRLTLVDDDRVERSNLQRQILHDENALGRPKVESARERLAALNPDIAIDAVQQRLDAAAADRLVAGQDLVVDGSDNFPTRYAINDACARAGVPMIYGAVERFTGQVGVFAPGLAGGSCYRCLFPEDGVSPAAPSCAEAGVLGVLPGIIGSMQALEAIKWLSADPAQRAEPGWVAAFDGLRGHWHRIRVPRDPDCPTCRLDPTAP